MLKNTKGVIFDFNGTLFFDSDKHEKAWKQFIAELDTIPQEEPQKWVTVRQAFSNLPTD